METGSDASGLVLMALPPLLRRATAHDFQVALASYGYADQGTHYHQVDCRSHNQW
jgi:hypothetical protein